MDFSCWKNLSENSFTTDCEPRHVRLVWRVKHWLLSPEFHGHNDRAMWSSVYTSQHCKWRIGLIFNRNQSGVPNEMYFKLQMDESEYDVTFVTARGEIIVVEDDKEGKVGGKLDGDEAKKTMGCDNEVFKFSFCREIGKGSYICSDKCSVQKEDGSFISDIIAVIADFKMSFGKPEAELKCFQTPSVTTDKTRQMAEVIKSLDNMLSSKQLCDLTVHVGGLHVGGHKVVFAARSPVFKALIEKAREKPCVEIEIKIECASEEAWSVFQRFLYTGDTGVDDEKMRELSDDLFRLAKEYQVSSLIDHMLVRLRAMLGRSTVLEVLEIAYRNDVATLQQAGVAAMKGELSYLKSKKRSQLISFVQRNSDRLSELLNDIL